MVCITRHVKRFSADLPHATATISSLKTKVVENQSNSSVFVALRRALYDDPAIFLLSSNADDVGKLRMVERNTRVVEISDPIHIFGNFTADSACDFTTAPIPGLHPDVYPNVSQTRLDQLNYAIIMNYQKIKTILEDYVQKGKRF